MEERSEDGVFGHLKTVALTASPSNYIDYVVIEYTAQSTACILKWSRVGHEWTSISSEKKAMTVVFVSMI